MGIRIYAHARHPAAARFCRTLPGTMIDGDGDIRFGEGRVSAVHPHEGNISFSLRTEDEESLRRFNRRGFVGNYTSDINLCSLSLIPRGVAGRPVRNQREVELLRI